MEKTPARFIWHYVKIFKWSFLLIGFLVVVRQITEAIGPWYLAKIYETVSAASESGIPWQRLYIYAFWLAAVMLAGMLVAESAMFIIARFMPKMRTMVIKDTFEDVNRQSISFFSREMTGNISGKVQLLSNNTIELTGFSHEIFYMVSNLLVKTVVLSWISWYYTVLMAFWFSSAANWAKPGGSSGSKPDGRPAPPTAPSSMPWPTTARSKALPTSISKKSTF